MRELIDKQLAIDALGVAPTVSDNWADEYELGEYKQWKKDVEAISSLPSAQQESTRTFVELVVEYPDPELCTYKEYKGKPYYSIKYIENGETYIGYGTYKPEVLSQYLREYFMPSAQPEQRWIPVTERLPDPLQEVLVTSTRGYVYTSRIVHGDFEYGGNVIAWMPLPEPYGGEADEAD